MTETSTKAFNIGLILVAFIGLLSVVGLFSQQNRIILSGVSFLSPSINLNSQTLLLEHNYATDDEFLTAISEVFIQLAAMQPKAIIYTHYQSEPPVSLINQFPEIVWINRSQSSEQQHLHNHPIWPYLVKESGVISGYRLAQPLSSKQLDALNSEPILQYRNNGQVVFFNPLIDYSVLPHLTLEQVNSGGMLDQLVLDRVIVIDELAQRYQIKQNLAYTSNELTETEAYLYAIEHELSNFGLSSPPVAVVFLVSFIIYFSCFICFQLFAEKTWISVNLFFVLSFFAIHILCGRFYNLVFPFYEAFFTLIFCNVYLVIYEKYRESRLISNTSATVNARISKKLLPPDFLQSNKPWLNLHVLVNQHIPLLRSIFLEKVEDNTLVREIDAFNCSLDDISERRRDFKRTPYSTALERNCPIVISPSHYFVEVADNESEYLVPLQFSGNLLGFWALTVITPEGENKQLLENHLAFYATEISVLLHQRLTYLKFRQQQAGTFRRLLQFQVAEADYRAMDASVSLLEQRYDMFQHIFNNMTSAAILYDLFGHIIFANKKLENLMQIHSVDLYQCTAHDLLVKFTKLKSNEIKDRLLAIILQDIELDFPVENIKLSKKYLIRVRSLKNEEQDQAAVSKFLATGLLVEFVDIETIQSLVERKALVYEQHFHQMRNNLSIMNLLSRKIKKQQHASPDDLNNLEDILAKTEELGEKVERQLKSFQVGSNDAEPVDVKSVLNEILSQFSDELHQKNIHVDYVIPNIMSLALLPIKFLHSIMANSIKLLIEDAVVGESKLFIEMVDSEKSTKRVIQIVLRNEGYGVPEEHLNDMKKNLVSLSAKVYSESEKKLAKVLTLVREAPVWGVTANIESSLGAGYQIEIQFPIFETKLQE